jgi:hypothetical protein
LTLFPLHDNQRLCSFINGYHLIGLRLLPHAQCIGIYLLENNFFLKINYKKVNYFLIFDSVIKNKLENTFQCLVMSWKMSWKITY